MGLLVFPHLVSVGMKMLLANVERSIQFIYYRNSGAEDLAVPYFPGPCPI